SFPRRREDEALLRQAEIAARGSHDAPDEQVEQHEERDLEDQQRRVDGYGRGDHWPSRSNVISVEPSVIVSPLRSFARFTRLPLTSIPFVEPRSTIQYEAPSCLNSACRRETLASASWTSQSRERPMTMRGCLTWRLSPFQLSVTSSGSTPSSS